MTGKQTRECEPNRREVWTLAEGRHGKDAVPARPIGCAARHRERKGLCCKAREYRKPTKTIGCAARHWRVAGPPGPTAGASGHSSRVLTYPPYLFLLSSLNGVTYFNLSFLLLTFLFIFITFYLSTVDFMVSILLKFYFTVQCTLGLHSNLSWTL
jgi:hypothetical protein